MKFPITYSVKNTKPTTIVASVVTISIGATMFMLGHRLARNGVNDLLHGVGFRVREAVAK